MIKRLLVPVAFVILASAACGESSSLNIPEGELEDGQIMTNDESNRLINGPGSSEEKQQAICDDMEDAGTFDDMVSAEDVGC